MQILPCFEKPFFADWGARLVVSHTTNLCKVHQSTGKKSIQSLVLSGLVAQVPILFRLVCLLRLYIINQCLTKELEACAWIHAESIFIQLHLHRKNTVQVSVKTKAWSYWHKHLTDLFTKSCLTPECQKLTTTFSPTATVCPCPSFWRLCFTSHVLNNRLYFAINTRATHRETVIHSWINLTLSWFLYACIPVFSSSHKKILVSLLCRCVRPSWSSLGELLV